MPGFPRTRNNNPYFTLQCWQIGPWESYWADYGALEAERDSCFANAERIKSMLIESAIEETWRESYEAVVWASMEALGCIGISATQPTVIIPGVGTVATGTILASCWLATAGNFVYNAYNAQYEFQQDVATQISIFETMRGKCLEKFHQELPNIQQSRDRALDQAKREYEAQR